jgi:hypothetical protein
MQREVELELRDVKEVVWNADSFSSDLWSKNRNQRPTGHKKGNFKFNLIAISIKLIFF